MRCSTWVWKSDCLARQADWSGSNVEQRLGAGGRAGSPTGHAACRTRFCAAHETKNGAALAENGAALAGGTGGGVATRQRRTTMQRSMAVALASAMLLTTPAIAQSQNWLVGSWTMVSATQTVDGRPQDYFGPHPLGQVIFGPTGSSPISCSVATSRSSPRTIVCSAPRKKTPPW